MECCNILLTSFCGLKFFFFYWSMSYWNTCPVLFLQFRTAPPFGSMTCSQQSRGLIQSGVWWEIKRGVPPLVTDWSSHLSPADGVALGKSHDSLLRFLVYRIRKILSYALTELLWNLLNLQYMGALCRLFKYYIKITMMLCEIASARPFSLFFLGAGGRPCQTMVTPCLI